MFPISISVEYTVWLRSRRPLQLLARGIVTLGRGEENQVQLQTDVYLGICKRAQLIAAFIIYLYITVSIKNAVKGYMNIDDPRQITVNVLKIRGTERNADSHLSILWHMSKDLGGYFWTFIS